MGFLWLFLLLGSPTLVVPSCPSLCRCADTIVDCMVLGLTEDNIPTSFPPLTTTLYLNGNELVSIPNGLFDNLKNIQEVYLNENPWVCDCNIVYLRSWLQWQQNRSFYRNIVCTFPLHLRGRIVAYLSEDEILSTCQYWYCSVALLAQILLFIFILVQAILLFLVILYLRKFRRLAKEVKRTATEMYENADLWATLPQDSAD